MAVVVKAVPGPAGRVATSSAAALAIRTSPALALLPPLSAEEFAALREDIAKRGVAVPLEVDGATGLVVDGAHRLRAAKEVGLETVPIRARYFASEDERVEHCLAVNLLRRHVSPSQRRELVRWLRGQRRWSGTRIAEALHAAKATIYRDLQVLDATDPAFTEPAVVTGKDRRGQRPYRRRTGTRVPTGGRTEGERGRDWIPRTPRDEARLVRTGLTELRAWLHHHRRHLAEVGAFAAAFKNVVREIGALPDPV